MAFGYSLSATSRELIMYLVLIVCLSVSVCVSVRNQFCKQDVSKPNLCIFVKFIDDTAYITTLEMINFWCIHITFNVAEKSGPKFAICIWAIS